MNVRIKRNLLVFLIFPFGVFSIGIGLMLCCHWAFQIITVIYFVFMVTYIKNINCPNCNYSLGFRKRKLKDYEYETYSILTNRRCDNCGYEF